MTPGSSAGAPRVARAATHLAAEHRGQLDCIGVRALAPVAHHQKAAMRYCKMLKGAASRGDSERAAQPAQPLPIACKEAKAQIMDIWQGAPLSQNDDGGVTTKAYYDTSNYLCYK